MYNSLRSQVVAKLKEKGKSCKSCSNFVPAGCSLKQKEVKHYNICEYWGIKPLKVEGN